jgi:hypothetical protein
MKKIIVGIMLVFLFVWIGSVSLDLNPLLGLLGVHWKMAQSDSALSIFKTEQHKTNGHIKAVAYPEKDQVIDKVTFNENKNAKDVFINFRSLSKKVLRSNEQEKLLKQELANLKLIKTSFDILEAKNESEFNHALEQTRMTAVDFFGAALDWKENPRRKLILVELLKLTSKFTLDGKLPERQRKSLLTDKMELISILNRNQPERVKKIIESKQGTVVGKYYSLALNLYQ